MTLIDRRRFLAGAVGLTVAAIHEVPYVSLGSYEPEAAELFDRMTVRPETTRLTAINALIASLKKNDIWSRLDGLYMLAAHTQQAALLNWRRPTAKLIAINSPIFSPNTGFSGDGVASYLTNQNSAMSKMRPTDHMLTAGLSKAGEYAENSVVSIANWSTSLDVFNAKDKFSWQASSSDTRRVDSGRATLITLTRDSASAAHAVLDGKLVDTDTKRYDSNLSFGATEPLTILRGGEAYSAGCVSFVAYGGSLSAKRIERLHAAVETFLIHSGAER